MGLDLTISEQTEFRKDSKGRPCYTVTELMNIHGRTGHIFLDLVGQLSDLSNCSTMTIDAMDIFNGLDTMRDNLAEYDTVEVKTRHEKALNTLSQLLTFFCEKYSIPSKDIITKWDNFCSAEELEQKNRLTDTERNEVIRAEREVIEAGSDLKEVNDYESIIADIEQFNRDNNLKKDELTWGDRTFEVHIWY